MVTWNRHHETVPQRLDCSSWEVWTKNSTWVFLAPVDSSGWHSLYRFPDMPTCDKCSQRRVEGHMVYQIIFFTKHSRHQGTSYQSIRQNWEGRKYKLSAWLRVYTYKDIFDWERGRDSCHNKGGKGALYWLDFVWQSSKKGDTIEIRRGKLCWIYVVYKLWFSQTCGEIFFFTEETLKLCLPPTWGTEQSSGCHVKPNNN